MMPHPPMIAHVVFLKNQLLDQNIFYKELLKSVVTGYLLGKGPCGSLGDDMRGNISSGDKRD